MLQYQDIALPLVAGIDEATSDRVAQPPRLAQVINGVITKRGAIEKRCGFQQVGAGVLHGGYRGIASSGTELLSIGGQFLYGYSPQTGNWTWKEARRISPCYGTTRTLARDQYDWKFCDLDVLTASGKQYILMARTKGLRGDAGAIEEACSRRLCVGAGVRGHRPGDGPEVASHDAHG